MKKTPRLHKILNGALILSLASLIAKLLSAVYRIPLQNLVGNAGFYVYQQVYPLYGIGVSLALSGLPVYISKVIAQSRPENQMALAKQLFKCLAVIGIILMIGCWLFAPQLALAMGDENLKLPIRAVALMFVWLPFLAVGRGLEQGRYQMAPTAISQLIEQVFRVSIVIAVAVLFVPMKWSIYQMGFYAMLSAFVAQAAASISLRKAWLPILRTHTRSDIKWTTVLQKLMTQGMIVCLFAAMMVLLQLVDSFTVYRGLLNQGLSDEVARQLKGIYDRNQPLLQLGLVIATSFSAAILPALSQTFVRGQMLQFKRILQALVHVSVTIASLATCGLIVLMPQINQLLFVDRSQVLTLQVSVISILLASMVNVYSAVLQSINYFNLTVYALVAGIVSKVGLNYILVTQLGIIGASTTTVISLMVMLVIVLGAILKQQLPTGLKVRFISKLIAVNVVMMIVAAVVKYFLEQLLGVSRPAMLGVVFGTILVAIVVVGLTTWQLHLFTIAELVTIPGGKHVLKLIKRVENRRTS